MLHVGHESYVNKNRIVAIVPAVTAPVKRMISEAKDTSMAIDTTYGRKTRSAVVTDSGHIVLSSVKTEALKNRLNEGG